MLKISPPSNLSAFDRPAVFAISGTSPATEASTIVEAVLEDADNGSVVAARRLHLDSSASAQFDVAPILRRALALQPADSPTGLAVAEDCRFRVRMRIGAVVSDAVTLISTRPKVNAIQVISGMPRRRTIRYGESDRLTFYALSDFSVEVEAATDTATTLSTYRWDGYSGLIELRLRTRDFDPAIRRIAVRMSGSTVAEYTVDRTPADTLRVAWHAVNGILEHYDFPVVARRTLTASHRSVSLADGTCTVAAGSRTLLTLRSHCETAATIEALAAIAASPQVWAVDSSGIYVSLAVETQQVVTRSFGEPSNVELTVAPSQSDAAL